MNMFANFQWDLNFFKHKFTGEKKKRDDYNLLAPLLTRAATQTLKVCYFIRAHLSSAAQWVVLLW